MERDIYEGREPVGPRPPTPHQLAYKRIGEELPGLISSLVLKANEGDVQAIKVLLDKGLPNIKPVNSSVPPMPHITGLTLIEKSNAIVHEIVLGRISPDVGKLMLDALKVQSDLQQAHELLERLEALERMVDK